MSKSKCCHSQVVWCTQVNLSVPRFLYMKNENGVMHGKWNQTLWEVKSNIVASTQETSTRAPFYVGLWILQEAVLTQLWNSGWEWLDLTLPCVGSMIVLELWKAPAPHVEACSVRIFPPYVFLVVLFLNWTLSGIWERRPHYAMILEGLTLNFSSVHCSCLASLSSHSMLFNMVTPTSQSYVA